MARRFAPMLFLLGLVGVTCDDSGVASNDTEEDSFPTDKRLAATQSVFMARCAYESRCAEQRGREHGSQADCESLAAFNTLSLISFVQSIQAGVTDRNVTIQFSDADVAACVSAWRSFDCLSELSFPSKCDALFSAQAVETLTAGQLCGGDAVARPGRCGEDAHCAPTGIGDCRVCVPTVAAGEACDALHRCDPALRCEGGVCREKQPPAGRGEPCPDFNCLGELSCIGPEGSRSCQDRLEEGRTCRGANNPLCHTELECSDSGACERRLANGELCTRDESPGCLNFCVFESPLDEVGVCRVLEKLPSAGEPCAVRAGGVHCAPGTNWDQTSEGCVCAALFLPGARCSGNWECESNVCSNRVCENAARANGEECPSRNDEQCESGNCDTSLDPPLCTAACAERLASSDVPAIPNVDAAGVATP